MPPHFRPTGRLARARSAARLLAIVESVGQEFPELDGRTIRVDLLGGRRLNGLAFAAERPPRIALRPRRVPPGEFGATVAHELTHLLQWPDRRVPNGERACDLFAMARTGHRFAGPPSYLRIPSAARRDWGRWAAVAQSLARRAIVERANGRRAYLVWWEAAFRRAVAESPPTGAGPHILSPHAALDSSPLR